MHTDVWEDECVFPGAKNSARYRENTGGGMCLIIFHWQLSEKKCIEHIFFIHEQIKCDCKEKRSSSKCQ